MPHETKAEMSVPHAAGASRPVAAALVLAVLGASALIGRRNAPAPSHPSVDRWYHRLNKPAFTPPDAVFGATWPVLETTIAVGGYRLLRRPGTRSRNAAVGLWLITSGAIGGWTEIFFRRHALATSTAAAAAMTATSAAYVAAARKVDRLAALAGVPLTIWLGFATVLADAVRRRNH